MLYSLFKKGRLFSKIEIFHLLPDNTRRALVANYNSREEAFIEAFNIEYFRFDNVINELNRQYVPAPRFEVNFTLGL